MILSKFSYGPSKAILSIASNFLISSLFLTRLLIKCWTLNTLSQVVVHTHCTLAKLAKTSNLGYRICKTWFHVIMSHESLQVSSFHSVVAYNLKAKNPCLQAITFIRGEKFIPSCERSCPYWASNFFNSLTLQFWSLICVKGMLVGFRILKYEIKSLSINLISNHLETTFVNANWNSNTSSRSLIA